MDKQKYIERYNKLVNFIEYGIWNLDLSELGNLKRKLFKNIKIIIITVKNFGKQNLGWQAVALSFFTTMSFIPFIAVTFAISNRIGLGAYLRSLIYDNFENDAIIDQVLVFADNIIRTAREGPYGIISFLVFVWLVIWLMICIERCFNQIWKVKKTRVFWKRGLVYFAVIITFPIIMVVLLSVSLTITNGINTIGIEIPFLDSVSNLLIWGLFYIFVISIFTVAYMLIPNAKVRFIPSLKAAIISALAFTIVQYLYLETQVFVSRMNAVYGVFAAVPLFMAWVNTAWFILLIGSELSYAFQNVDNYPLEELS